MRHRTIAVTGLALILAGTYGVAGAADQCPELTQAKAALNSAKASLKKGSRSLAGAKSQDVQSPRGQDIQSPRSQDIQSPRGQDIQSPRGQDIQSPRSLSGSTAGASKAFQLVKEAEAACAKGDTEAAKAKAISAMELMK